MKQFVPVPYYIPKPIYKYILRHHYVPVKQVVVKPVPVPYPVKYSKKEYKSSYGYDSESEGSPYYGAASSNSYGSGGDGSSGGNHGGTSDGYETPGDLSYSQGDTATSSSNAVDYGNVDGVASSGTKYSQTGSGMQPMYDDYSSKGMMPSTSSSSSSSASSSSANTVSYGSPYGYENAGGLYAAPSTLSPSTVSMTGNSNTVTSGTLKTSASENFYFSQLGAMTRQQPPQQTRGFYDDAYYNSYSSGGRSKASVADLASESYHSQTQQQPRLYAPVYSNAKGQLYSSGQVYPSTLIKSIGRGGTMSSYHGESSSSSLPSSAASVISAFPTPYASSPYTPSSLTSAVFSAVGPGMPALASYHDSGLMSMTSSASSPMTSTTTTSASTKKKKESFSAELQKKAKKLFTETFSKRGVKLSTTTPTV